MPISKLAPRHQLPSAATAARHLRDISISSTAAAAPAPSGRQAIGRSRRAEDAACIEPGLPEDLLSQGGLSCALVGSPSVRRRQLGRLPDHGTPIDIAQVWVLHGSRAQILLLPVYLIYDQLSYCMAAIGKYAKSVCRRLH